MCAKSLSSIIQTTIKMFLFWTLDSQTTNLQTTSTTTPSVMDVIIDVETMLLAYRIFNFLIRNFLSCVVYFKGPTSVIYTRDTKAGPSRVSRVRHRLVLRDGNGPLRRAFWYRSRKMQL